MKREQILGVLISLMALSIVLRGVQAPPAGPTSDSLAATKIEKVKDNLYIITGSGAEAPRRSVVGTLPYSSPTPVSFSSIQNYRVGGQVILDRVKTVTSKPVVRVINTHTHADHTGSNAFFGATIDSIVQENTKRIWRRWTISKVTTPLPSQAHLQRQDHDWDRQG
jgi:glyoxylase-like metal-dependent hydrolase (beta-lactamase superfamily II)